MASLKELADALVTRLKAEGFIVQRYDAYSTDSVYLKLDYGVCNSIRISDHSGKKHLAYRYNLIKGCRSAHTVKTQEGWARHFFPAGQSEKLIARVISARENKLQAHGRQRYTALMADNQAKHQNDQGFWRHSRVV